MPENDSKNNHVDLTDKIGKKTIPPFPPASAKQSAARPPRAVVFTSTKQIMRYVTVKAIESDISKVESDWPLFCEQQLLDNSCDFLDIFYPNSPKQDRVVAVRIKMGDSQIKVINSNIDNIEAFDNLQAIFDYKQWHSSKRYQHRLMYTGETPDDTRDTSFNELSEVHHTCPQCKKRASR